MPTTVSTPVNLPADEPVPFAVTEAAEQLLTAEPRTWLRRIWKGGQIVETCPAWCTDTHWNDQSGYLVDLCHGDGFQGPELSVFDAEDGMVQVPLFTGRINVDPYSSEPARNVPHVHLEPYPDQVMECLTPDEFAAVIAQLRAHCDRLDQVHARLVEARAEWQGQA
ncbi:DUF6907 domain-containing protein [Streptomyces mesophilus]|uniref:DUF6907 domain-containing protein n=1 Tax=Streptomyces mesophilus TaxID=1775132 RepID=UPI003329E218